MRIYMAAALTVGLLAGCSSGQDATQGKAAAAIAADKAIGAHGVLPFTGRSPMTSFASLPDRGELLSYVKTRPVKHSGAYTAYPVALSEAHALDSMRTGEMVVTAPNGEPIHLTYDRRVEHADGNWTWIGHGADGANAIMTFGENAAFGTIPQGATGALRLTVNGGKSWLVQTDATKLAGQHAGRREGTDAFVPPKSSIVSGGISAASSQPQVVHPAAAAAPAVIDVLLGYTQGFVDELMAGDSGAQTRLNYLVDTANQAYLNSGVNMRVRLVKTVKVNYPDNTDNGDALEKLSGFKQSNSNPVATDPAFDELRKARDSSGADLVSLVRAFNNPENNGCGIAWIIGGGGTGIEKSDAPFGYSVISDGLDSDSKDGKDYFCGEETLAHEMGHNMGQAHNTEDAEGQGVHSYSYGYRETTATGFYTVMAYPLDDDQSLILYFANPNVKDASSKRVTGVANKSDNVRSMNLTMPIVATFRSTVVPLGGAPSDFNGDGKSDVLWRKSTGRNLYWNGASYGNRVELESIAGTAWFVADVGDFSGDGKADILWRNSGNDRVVLWKDGKYTGAVQLDKISNKTWQVAGAGDFNGDGKADILWRNTSNGRNLYWSAGDSSKKVELHTINDKTWIVAGVGNFDGDSVDDILWRNTSSGRNLYWGGGAYAKRLELHKIDGNTWSVVGVGDFNGDGKSDVLWRNTSSGRDLYWGAGAYSSLVELHNIAGNNWSVEQAADFDGDGRSDILWRNKSSGRNLYWSGGSYAASKELTATGATWKVVP